MKFRTLTSLAIGLVLLLATGRESLAVLANAFHIPDDNTEVLSPTQTGLNMRSPEFEISTNTTVTIYSGVQKLNNSYGTANQTGGTLYYKSASSGTWSSVALGFANNNGNNQYWSASFNTSAFGPDDVIQYYLYLTFDGVNGVQNTYLYGADAGSLATATQSTAVAAPFSIRNRPAWLFHDGNRVVTANASGANSTVSFWIKIGYQSEDATVRWASNACVYYTIDGSTPAGALGVPSGATAIMPLSYDHEQDDPSIAGNDMWWVGTVTNLPNNTAINYKIGVWNSANNEEKFADYNAGANDTIFNFSIGATTGTNGMPMLTVDGMNAEYTTEHFFVDEVAGDAVPVTVLFSPNTNNVVEADVFSNLNRRNRATLDANADGIEDGILPPNGNLIPTGDDNNYYKAYAMTPTATPGQYSLTLDATNCGDYRLTARYKVAGNTNWLWYGLRDHVLVVTPPRARNIVMYELNAMNIDAQGTGENDRSTFTDLYNGPGSRPYDPVTNRFNLNYFQNLGVNWLWFQPIHPIGAVNRQTDPNTGQPYTVGSPYSIKNFFQINPLLSKANTRAAGMQEFTNFVAAANTAGINVMLDEPFPDTSWDCELDAAGVAYFATNGQPTDEIANDQPLVYSRTNEYDQRATSAATVAVSPDRYDFGKWTDVAHIYYGRYAALVPNSAESTNYLSEGDWFDYSIGSENSTGSGNGHFDTITQNVWRYYSDCLLYWLTQTGCPTNTPPSQTAGKGIGGLRADFGQGLPPQAWEYIINKVRSRKWDFVFMTESLDGGVVTYRSNRQFDILNENLVFSLQSAAVASDYRNAFDARRTDYGQALVLLNNDSHDEESYADPFEALIRYQACGAIDGAPMTCYGEELGISTDFGFDEYQLNFGKTIPNFMVYNDLQPICSPANRNFGLDQLVPVYAGVNQARQFSAALKSSNRYYLNQISSEAPQPSIFSVAKYQTANGDPRSNDVVFAFVNLDRNNTQGGVFDVNITQNGSNLFGIQPSHTYNVRNIAAYLGADNTRRNQYLISGGVLGSTLLSNGLYVQLNPVPTTNAGWTNAPFEAQYLKLYDVTPTSTAPVLSMSSSSVLTWTSVSNATYQVFFTPSLSTPFSALGGVITAAGTTSSYTNNPSGAAGYYRVEALQ